MILLTIYLLFPQIFKKHESDDGGESNKRQTVYTRRSSILSNLRGGGGGRRNKKQKNVRKRKTSTKNVNDYLFRVIVYSNSWESGRLSRLRVSRSLSISSCLKLRLPVLHELE